MRFKIIFFTTFLVFALLSFGCGGAEPTNNNQNAANTPNSNASTTNANNSLNTTKTPEIATTNDAPTLSPVVKAYCEAMTKKDEAAVRKTYSQETIKSFEEDMKAEGKTSLIEFLVETDAIKDVNQCGARNEKIEGDKAVAEIRNENMPNGVKIEFVKENGEWKLTNKAVFDSVKPAETNSAK